MRRAVMILSLVALGVAPAAARAQEADERVAQEPPVVVGEQESDEKTPRWAKEPWEKIRYGIKAGASWAALAGQLPLPGVGTFGFDGDFGFAAGISFEVPVSRKFSIQPEVLIVRKHAEIDLEDSGFEGSEKLSVNYLEIPLLAKWYPGSRRGTIFSLQAGPAMGIRMDALRSSRHADGTIEDVEGETLVKATDWGLILGAGVEFHEFLWALTVDLRYNHGLSDIDNSGSSVDAKWRALYVVAGVTW